MKKYLKTTIVVLGLGLLCLLGYNIYAKIQYKSTVAKTLQVIPKFSFVTLENQPFINDDLVPAKKTIFIYFNSECEYCQNEASSIEKSIEKLKNVQLIFVSDQDSDQIEKFATKYKLINYENVTFLSDPRGDFTTHFYATSIPYVLIYDQNQQLIKRHKGQLKIEKIIALIP